MTMRAITAGLVLAVTVLAGCATSVAGHGSGSAAASISSFPSSSRTIAPVPSTPAAPSSPGVPTSSSAPPLATQDITDIHYTVPKGFVTSQAYHPVSPLEKTWKAAYLIPAKTTPDLDVLSILLYSLPAGVHVNTLAAQEARVRAYDARTNTKALSKMHVEEVGGLPAIQENAFQPPKYKYAAWYVFGSRHFVLLSCQVEKYVTRIEQGCTALLRSVRLS